MTTLRALAVLSISVSAALSVGDEPIPLTPENGGMSIGVSALKAGDIIVSTTDGLLSEAIKSTTDAPVSHVMVYVGDQEVVEAVNDGVRKVSINDALDEGTLAVAFRSPKANGARVTKLISYLDSQVGKKYNHWGVGKQLACRKADVLCEVKMPGDRWYCSELVLAAFLESEMALTETVPKWKAPGDLINMKFEDQLNYVGHLIAQ